MATTYNSRNADKFVVRLEEGMRDQIIEKAADATQSMNGWIVTALRKSLDDNTVAPWTPSLDQLVYATDDAGVTRVGLIETINITEGRLIVNIYLGNDEPCYLKVKVPVDQPELLRKYIRPVVL